MRFKETKESNRSLILSIGRFAIPVTLSVFFQRMFNIIDTMMAGKSVGADALAAVGSTSTITGTILGLGAGFALGSNILVAKTLGENNHKKLEEMIQLSVWAVVVIGAISGVIGVAFSRQFLLWLNTPADILEQAVLYMRIYCVGMIGLLLYDTGSSVLRGLGDSKGPFYALAIAGIANIVMKLVFVVVFDAGILGLALATTLTQYISAICVLFLIIRRKGVRCLLLQKQTSYINSLKELSIIAISAVFESVFFSVANLVFQSSLNSLGSDAVAGYSIGSQIEGFVYPTMTCFYYAALSFVSQNYGAGKYKVIDKVLGICCGYVMLSWCIFGGLVYLCKIPLLGMFTDEPMAIEYGLLHLQVMIPIYFLVGLQEVLRASVRGMNRSVCATIGSMLFYGIVRVAWIGTVFQKTHNFQVLILSVPVSYMAAIIGFAVIYFIVRRRQRDNLSAC